MPEIENTLELKPAIISNFPKTENETTVKSIHLFEDQFIIKDEPVLKIKSDELFPADKLSGAYIQGIQYYDLKNIQFINNTGMADLISLLRSLLKKGVEVQFVNVNENIKNKIKSMGLDHILNCK